MRTAVLLNKSRSTRLFSAPTSNEHMEPIRTHRGESQASIATHLRLLVKQLRLCTQVVTLPRTRERGSASARDHTHRGSQQQRRRNPASASARDHTQRGSQQQRRRNPASASARDHTRIHTFATRSSSRTPRSRTASIDLCCSTGDHTGTRRSCVPGNAARGGGH